MAPAPSLHEISPNKIHTFAVSTYHLGALGAIIYLPFYGISGLELSVNLLGYLLGGLGITVLYHRAWTHNAATLSPVVETFFAVCACLLVQGPGLTWVKEHIAHHQHTDTDNDPHNIHRGFFWAHIEWIFHQPESQMRLPARLATNKVLAWQHKYYIPLTLAVNIGLPLLLIAPFVTQPWWGIILVSALRVTLCNHVVWCINSVCHSFGSRPFTSGVTARDVWWFPLSMGEQYHNYHHTFPRDYRNGIRWYDLDPTKWLLAGLAKVGLATNLFAMPEEKIAAAQASAQIPQSVPLASSPLPAPE